MKQADIITCYNKTAENYASQYIDEINKKHLDQILLESFARENFNKKLIDFGCGPGQTTKYLFDCGLNDITGVDISPSMIKVAKSIHPFINFETADILDLKYPDNTFDAAIAFYSIVHFDYKQLKTAFNEIKRVLTGNAQFLFSFHIGDKVVHLEEFLDHKVNIDFYFFETNKIIELLAEAGFTIIDIIEREPYREIEFQSKRAYIWVKNNKP